jgi:anti-anti-sigma factor
MLAIEVEKIGDVAVVRCAGRLVRGEEVRNLRQTVVCSSNTRIVMLDLSELEMLDAGGLAALLSLRQWAINNKVQLKLVNPSHFVNEVLVRTRLDRVFDISGFDHALFVLGGAECRYGARA